jgi:hypothetical protein
MKTELARFAPVLMLALGWPAYSQEKPAAPPSANASYTMAASPSATSDVGLLNSWLRQESPVFTPWDFGGQLRVRYELKENGGVAPNIDFRRAGVDNDNSYLELRERIHAGYAPVSWFSIFAEGRDSSSTGDERHPSPDADAHDLYQAFVRLGDPSRFPLTAKIGRQELIYGDERLVGNADWYNVPRTFDAAKVRFEVPNLWVDAFASRVVVPVPQEFNEANDYDWFSGLYGSSSTLIPGQETQLYFLSRNASPQAAKVASPSLYPLPGARDIYTLGAHVKSLPGQWNGWDYAAEIGGQLGSINLPVPGAGAHRLDHEAFAAFVAGGYTWREALGTPRLGAEYNFASGDSNPKDGKDQTFENLFPTNHRLYGYMDFFSWRNLHDPRLSASLRPIRPLLLTLDYHAFWLADTQDFFYPISGPGRGASGPAQPGEPVSYGRNPQFNSFVGSELDLEAIYTPKNWLTVRAGYGHFFVGDYVRSSLAKVGGATDANWAYLQMTVNF